MTTRDEAALARPLRGEAAGMTLFLRHAGGAGFGEGRRGFGGDLVAGVVGQVGFPNRGSAVSRSTSSLLAALRNSSMAPALLAASGDASTSASVRSWCGGGVLPLTRAISVLRRR